MERLEHEGESEGNEGESEGNEGHVDRFDQKN